MQIVDADLERIEWVNISRSVKRGSTPHNLSPGVAPEVVPILGKKTTDTSLRRFTHRELTLILYKAAELQEVTWWLRSVRLMLRLPRRKAASYDLRDIRSIAAEMGIEARFVEEAVGLVGDNRKWEAT